MADERLDKAGEYKVVFDGVGTAAHAPARSWPSSTSAAVIGANAGRQPGYPTTANRVW